MAENEEQSSLSSSPPSKSVAPSLPTITLPPRGTFSESLSNGGPGCPGPRTLVSSFVNYSAMASPAAASQKPKFSENVSDISRLSQPSVTFQGLPGFRWFPPAQGPFGMTKQQGLAHSTYTVDKLANDGYSWRKYWVQQGSEFTQSGYKCTHRYCPAGKYVEGSLNGQVTEIKYIGQHNHQPRQHISFISPRATCTSVLENEPSAYLTQLSSLTANTTTQQQMPPDSRVTMSDFSHSDQRSQPSTYTVDKLANDGYSWRKYGQKQLKGTDFTRSYYKCSHRYCPCPARKCVERSLVGKGTKIMYNGQHNHQPRQHVSSISPPATSRTSVLENVEREQQRIVERLEAMDNTAKHCVKHCALYPKGEWVDKSSLISYWIKDHLVYSHDEGNFVLRSLTHAFLLEDYVVNHVRLNGEIYDVLVNLLVPKIHPMFLNQGDSEKTESMKEEEWNAKEIYLMDTELHDLPESPNCSSLIALYLQKNYDLAIIPPLFFEHMPVLQVLDLSHTSIKYLPESLPKLVALRKLVLRGCELFMELSPKVGKLKNLEELDLDETQIVYLPVEIRMLVKLKRLRVSFYGPMNCNKKRLQSNTVINTGVISSLSQLTELSIDVNPDDERWNEIVEAIIEEVCSSKMLDTLSLYLPRVELLKKKKQKRGSTSLIHHPLSRFSFVVGHHIRRIIPRVPDEVEARFREWDKCLKFVNGRDIPDEITQVLKKATAFYLERNATAMTLSEFGFENMKKLKFCLLAECNEMQTIIGGGEFHAERSDIEDEDESYFEFGYDSDSSEEVVLGSLIYLGIYYMNNLRSIWKGPIHECSLSNLKFLAIRTCPKLSTIFSVDLLANLINLEELIIEDCPQVTCLVSHASSNPASVNYLPSLRKISLLFLPELVSISSGLHIAPELERISFYYCPKLENLSTIELSSKNLKVVKGERKWWDEALKWNESDWGSRPDHLNDIFHEIDEEKDVMTQLTEQE